MQCPGCGFVVGRFRAVADGDDAHVGAITCRRTGVSYNHLQQDIPKRPPMAGSKPCKRRKSRRPTVIAERLAERRDAADSKTKSRKQRKVQRLAEAA
jgi:hypothetical protein